jgi:hypothetical protein
MNGILRPGQWSTFITGRQQYQREITGKKAVQLRDPAKRSTALTWTGTRRDTDGIGASVSSSMP